MGSGRICRWSCHSVGWLLLRHGTSGRNDRHATSVRRVDHAASSVLLADAVDDDHNCDDDCNDDEDDDESDDAGGDSR